MLKPPDGAHTAADLQRLCPRWRMSRGDGEGASVPSNTRTNLVRALRGLLGYLEDERNRVFVPVRVEGESLGAITRPSGVPGFFDYLCHQ